MQDKLQICNGKGILGGRLISFQAIPSTNCWALENSQKLEHGDVILAINQTVGRGRFDRKWTCPGNKCLTFSVILKSEQTGESAVSRITQIAALAIAEVLEKFTLQSTVKWPNDVMVNSRKIAGILAEMDFSTSTIVLGLGLNINMTEDDFSSISLLQPATSMKIEGHRDYSINDVFSSLLAIIEIKILQLSDKTLSAIAEEWHTRDFLAGMRINIMSEGSAITGLYAGIDEEGRLKMQDNSGKQYVFWAGDVSVRPAE